MNHKNLLKDFLEEQLLKGRSKMTIEQLRIRVLKLFRYLAEHELDINQIRIRQAREYQQWLLDTGGNKGGRYCTETVRAYIYGALSFYDFLKKNSHVPDNPFKEIRRIRRQDKVLKNLPKQNQLSKLLDRLSRFYEEKSVYDRIAFYRTHVLAELMYSTGLRINEAAFLKPEDIDFEKSTVYVRNGKGGKARTCFLNDYAKNVLSIYIRCIREHLTKFVKKDTGTLFGIKREALLNSASRVLKKTAADIDLKTFTPHYFRHSLGYHLLRAGCNIRHIQAILGHTCIKTTEIYTKVDKEDLKKIIDTYHPRQWKAKEK